MSRTVAPTTPRLAPLTARGTAQPRLSVGNCGASRDIRPLDRTREADNFGLACAVNGQPRTQSVQYAGEC